MAQLTPVDYDPFAQQPQASGPTLVPVDHDPFAPAESKGIWDTIKTQAGNAAQAADDIIRMGANAATFGYADKLAAKGNEVLGSGSYDKNLKTERASSAAAADRAGSAGQFVDVAAPFISAGPIAKGVSAVAGGLRAVPVAGSILANPFTQAAATGATMGAADAAGHDQSIGAGAAVGAGAGLAGQGLATVLTKGISGAAGLFNKNPKLPTVEALRLSKDAAYKAADDAGVIFTPQMVDKLRQNVEKTLAEKAFLPANQPKVANVLSELEKMKGQNVTMKGLDAIRQMAGDAYEIGNKKSNSLARDIISHIDDSLAAPKTGEVLMGDAAAGSKAILQARKLNSQVSKIDAISQAMTKAERNSAASGTGGNIDNAIRQQIKNILNNPAKSRGFSSDEKAAMETVVRGTPGQNTARLLGRLSPQGNGLMAMLQALGAVQSGGSTLPLVGVGMAAKSAADRATPRNVEALSRILAAGGNRSDAFAAPNAVQRLAKSEREALARLLMSGGIASDPLGARQ